MRIRWKIGELETRPILGLGARARSNDSNAEPLERQHATLAVFRLRKQPSFAEPSLPYRHCGRE